ncbi:MAG TPA: two-component system response regulator [Phycisphaerales bacterium]|nr:two-component system response regulator [Phycisphaerales bacterium]
MNSKKILIVDDEPDILWLTSLMLGKAGYEILTADSGRDVFEIIQNQKPDLLLIDLILPVIYGNWLCKQIKSSEEFKHIPIILFTAYHDIMTAEKAKSLGADGFITKPFEAKELLAKIDNILSESAAL